jgi:alcohol dehydrogenase
MTVLAFQVANGKLRAVSKPRPRLRRGWALVRVRLAGICNTDIEILRGYHDFHGTPGHEFVGEVAELSGVSAGVRKKWLGRRVTGEINVSCSAYDYRPACEFCRHGLRIHCARRTVLGILGLDGAFAEYLTLPIENLHAVPDSVGDEEAVFVEPLAAACEILEQVRLQDPGSKSEPGAPSEILRRVRGLREAAVLGDGKLAQLIARVLRTVVPRVVMYGKHPKKLALARAARVETQRVLGNSDDLRRVKETYALLVEVTGSPTGLALAQQMTKPRGTLVLKSTFHGAAPVETWPIVVKEITVVGSRCGPFDKALALLCSAKVDPSPLVTRAFPLAAAKEAIGISQKSGVMKVLLQA